MIERLFGNEDVRQRLLAGPMGPYLDVLVSNILDLGYCHSQARKLVRTASALGDWLAERGLSPANAGKAELRTYMAARRRTPAGRLPEGVVGFTRLPALLQSMGILSRQSESPADPTLRRFEEHLANARGVTPSTQESYRRYVRPFTCRCRRADGELHPPRAACHRLP
jgi:hypothetical protein